MTRQLFLSKKKESYSFCCSKMYSETTTALYLQHALLPIELLNKMCMNSR